MNLEFDYIATLTRDYFLEERTASQPPSGLDWTRFVQLCIDQNVVGTLFPLIQHDGHRNNLPKNLYNVQRQVGESTILRLLFLEQILPELEKAGCKPIVLKGGALAPHYYKHPHQRYLADIDILVEPDQVDQACLVLKKLGLQFNHTGRDPEFYGKYHFHWIMANESGFIVEVHWALTLPQSIYKFDLTGLRDRARTVPLNKTSMLVPAPNDLLLHIVTQCTAGGFGEMRRIIDAALIFPAVEIPEALIRQALNQNQGTALWLLLNQVARYTTTPIPQDILDPLAPGKTTRILLTNLSDKMLRGKGEFLHRGEIPHLLHWLCAPTSSLRLRELQRFLCPGEEHWLESGFSPEVIPPFPARMWTRLSRLKTTLYFSWIAVWILFTDSTNLTTGGQKALKGKRPKVSR